MDAVLKNLDAALFKPTWDVNGHNWQRGGGGVKVQVCAMLGEV